MQATIRAAAAPGRPPTLLRKLHEAKAQNVLYGNFFEPQIAAAAQGKREIMATFTEGFSVPAKVLKTTDGRCVGRRGIWAGRALDLGPTAALQIGGITAVCVSKRKQCADPVFFEMHGLDIGAARTVVVKSRGHFRGGFDEFFTPERVIEVDTPGLTSPVLERLNSRDCRGRCSRWTPTRSGRRRPPSMSDELKSLGRYKIKGVLGKGAMGLVYDGLDPKLNRRVAIKTILTGKPSRGSGAHGDRALRARGARGGAAQPRQHRAGLRLRHRGRASRTS